jgi:hypothetical protein
MIAGGLQIPTEGATNSLTKGTESLFLGGQVKEFFAHELNIAA